MSQFDAKIIYIKGEDNCVADALSRLPSDANMSSVEQMACHPYTFCEDDDADFTVTSVTLPWNYSPWATARSLSSMNVPLTSINAMLQITADRKFLNAVKSGYANDEWCKTLPKAAISWPDLKLQDGLWYVGDHLIIPRTKNLRETLFTLAHDVLGHFGFDKTYGSLRSAYYWPNMRHDLRTWLCGLLP